MNKPELVAKIASESNITKVQAERITVAVFQEIGAALILGESVSIPDFGKFEVKARAERKGRNPATGEPITIPAGNAVTFKPSKALKDALHG